MGQKRLGIEGRKTTFQIQTIKKPNRKQYKKNSNHKNPKKNPKTHVETPKVHHRAAKSTSSRTVLHSSVCEISEITSCFCLRCSSTFGPEHVCLPRCLSPSPADRHAEKYSTRCTGVQEQLSHRELPIGNDVKTTTSEATLLQCEGCGCYSDMWHPHELSLVSSTFLMIEIPSTELRTGLKIC